MIREPGAPSAVVDAYDRELVETLRHKYRLHGGEYSGEKLYVSYSVSDLNGKPRNGSGSKLRTVKRDAGAATPLANTFSDRRSRYGAKRPMNGASMFDIRTQLHHNSSSSPYSASRVPSDVPGVCYYPPSKSVCWHYCQYAAQRIRIATRGNA